MNTRMCFVLALGVWLAITTEGAAATYNVASYGAVGNGKRDDSNAFLKAWQAACADPKHPTFLIPSGGGGMTFLLSQTTFSGPCKSNIDVQVSGNIVAPNNIWTNKQETWIIFININGLTVYGDGSIDGQGAIWWSCLKNKKCSYAPYILQFLGCDGLNLSGISLKNSPRKHLAIDNSKWVTIKGIEINSPGSSPNTDGILIFDSQHVDISDLAIGAGDDCIAIGPGCYDVNVTQVSCGPGHGISIGSLGVGSQVEKIHISDCTLSNTTNGVRIKTKQGGSGYAKDISFENINFMQVRTPILIDQFYCPAGGCLNQTSAVAVSDVTYNKLQGTSSDPMAVKLACSQSTSCKNIMFENVNFKLHNSNAVALSYCLNVEGKMVGHVMPKLSCLK